MLLVPDEIVVQWERNARQLSALVRGSLQHRVGEVRSWWLALSVEERVAALLTALEQVPGDPGLMAVACPELVSDTIGALARHLDLVQFVEAVASASPVDPAFVDAADTVQRFDRAEATSISQLQLQCSVQDAAKFVEQLSVYRRCALRNMAWSLTLLALGETEAE